LRLAPAECISWIEASLARAAQLADEKAYLNNPLMRFFRIFFPLTSVVANLILITVNRDKGLEKTLNQWNALIKENKHNRAKLA